MVAVFHRIGTPDKATFTNSVEQVNSVEEATYDGIYTSVFDNRLHLKPGILFISGDQIGREGFCNKEQLLELKRWGFKLGWHGWSHRRLTELSIQEIHAELRKPDWIEPLYAYPHGDFNEETKEIIEVAGYEKAYSTIQGDGSDFAIIRKYL
jgi:hypothetical protein